MRGDVGLGYTVQYSIYSSGLALPNTVLLPAQLPQTARVRGCEFTSTGVCMYVRNYACII